MNYKNLNQYEKLHLKETIGEVFQIKNKKIFFSTDEGFNVQLIKSTSVKCRIDFCIGDKYELIYYVTTKKGKDELFCELKKAKEFFENLTPNIILYGEIVSITKHGLFINFEYITGMIHWSRLINKEEKNSNPKDYLDSKYKLNEFVKAKVLKYENERLELEQLF